MSSFFEKATIAAMQGLIIRGVEKGHGDERTYEQALVEEAVGYAHRLKRAVERDHKKREEE